MKHLNHNALSPEELIEVRESSLYNEDLAPIPRELRTWTKWNIAALWVAMCVSIPTYSLASGLITQGMNWKQAVATIFLGNLIILIPMSLNACPGTAFGIPFPVLLRSSFGTLGSNIPALMRGLVACGWFGIQTWIGGSAIYIVAALLLDIDPSTKTDLPILGISLGELICFLLFWAINIGIILKGMDCIKWMENLSAPFLILIGLGLLWWAYAAADGFGPILDQQDRFESRAEFFGVFAAGLTAMVGFWATLSLNIPDFSRYARSQRDQLIGQAIGLPLTMAFYSGIGVIVTSATIVVYGSPIWNPVDLIAKFDNTALIVFALLSLSVATMSTNIAANVVSPANDLSNLSPRRISFRRGGVITGIIGICIFPWKLYEDPSGYIFVWLIGYGALLGPIGGIMIADYFIYRRQHLETVELYKEDGVYNYSRGFSIVAILSMVLAILPSLPGFLIKINLLSEEAVPVFFVSIYNFAWFVGFLVAFTAYLLGRKFLGRI